MTCRVCGSENQLILRGELTASSSSLSAAKLVPIYVCQDIQVCEDCGSVELKVPVSKLRALKRAAASS